MSYRDILCRQLEIDEGRRRKPYRDTKNYLTIGVGRNLDAVGLRDSEIDVMRNNDIDEAESLCRKLIPKFDALSEIRQSVVVNMAFNLGGKFAGFKKTLKAINGRKWSTAADHMLDSEWARQVGARAIRLSYSMRSDKL